MTASPTIRFVETARPTGGSVVLFVDDQRAFGSIGRALDEEAGGLLTRATKLAKFKGKRLKTMEVLAPAHLPYDRIVIAGLGADTSTEAELTTRGGAVLGALLGSTATVLA